MKKNFGYVLKAALTSEGRAVKSMKKFKLSKVSEMLRRK